MMQYVKGYGLTKSVAPSIYEWLIYSLEHNNFVSLMY